MRRLLRAIFPESASNLAPQVDHIYFALLALCGAVAFLIFLVAIFFCIRYRRGSKVDRTLSPRSPLPIEITWTVIPLLIFLGIFFWAAEVFFGMSRPPPNATEIYVVGKQWMWKIQHPDGRREINELHLPVGQPVKLIMTSQDVIHDFFIPAFRNKQDVVPGRYTTEWFTPDAPGKVSLFCSQYCGTNHSQMVRHGLRDRSRTNTPSGSRKSPPPIRSWRSANAFFALADAAVVTRRTQRFARRCSREFTANGCRLSDGTFVTADEQYLRDSILLPNKQIAAGYEPIMPTFKGQISEEELNALFAYLKSLGEKETP